MKELRLCVFALAFVGAVALAACGKQEPATGPNGGTFLRIAMGKVDKVDLLFVIDNSASMGDKQAVLADTVPSLVAGFAEPPCVDAGGKPSGQRASPTGVKENNYSCPPGTEPQFPPVFDMHIGVISSSLGNMGASGKDGVCDSDVNRRVDDRAHLLRSKKGGGEVELVKPSGFLSWFPTNPQNEDGRRHPSPLTPIAEIDDLSRAFQEVIGGVDQTGCGFEAQLESMYRFLIQPDPWTTITIDSLNQADLGVDVDVQLLQERADFLRPDSLVGIIMLTDEDDSSADPLSVDGQGWSFMARRFPGSKVFRNNIDNQGTTAARGTSACQSDPGSPDCTSCGFQTFCDVTDPACAKLKDDPNCQALGSPPRAGEGPDGYAGYYGPEADPLNVRFHRMKERFGVDPQYPIERYVDGLTKPKVPDRKAEHPSMVTPNGRRKVEPYAATPKCTNPLFAAKLPRFPGDELCMLPRGTRSPDLVFFALIGGVPNQLLHFTPGDPAANRLTNEDWVKLLGRDPARFDFDGIDMHMIASTTPRPGLPPASSYGDNGSDPIHGREWDTKGNDLQYACTFELPTPRSCQVTDPSCDCARDGEAPPLCNGQVGNGTQVKAKAYPTIRELRVAKALGDRAIVSSLCPMELQDFQAPTFGYKPAVAGIVDRLGDALTGRCLPSGAGADLPRETAGSGLACHMLVELASATDTCAAFGIAPPAKETIDAYREQERTELAGTSPPSALPLCEIPQQRVGGGATCRDGTNVAWCFEAIAGRCSSGALSFSAGTASLVGARFTLYCPKR